MENTTVLHNLFQKEFAKMVAVISKLFGLAHIEIAEDIVAETFLTATENWQQKGIPENPSAWLYTVAKQKTLYHFRRNKIFDEKIAPSIQSSSQKSEDMEPDFSQDNIKDSLLRMIFAICDPAIASEAQIGLALRILCGFGIEEIADAFLTSKDTINKRLFRAKEKLRQENIKMELPHSAQIAERLDNVLHVIYLLFNEGYYSTTQNQLLQRDLCFEALRLALLLTENTDTNLPKTNALIALMCFHASRFSARETDGNGPVLYEDQDKSLWDIQLILQGMNFLTLSAKGNEVTSYHIEAQIACWHCREDEYPEKWDNILQLYNRLLLINYSPAVALNRTFALYKTKGAFEALQEANKLNLEGNHFYYLLMAELYKDIDRQKAGENLEKALKTSKTESEKEIIMKKIVLLS